MKISSLKSLLPAAFLAALLLAIAGLALARKAPEPAVIVPDIATAVRVQTLVPADLPDVIELSGRLAADTEALLATEKAALVRRVLVDKGVKVRKNDVLLELDGVLWAASLKKAELTLTEAERDLARWRELARSGAAAASDLDRLQTQRDLAAETVTEMKAHVNQCFVRAPADGWIDQRFLSEGEFAPEGAAAYRFVVLDPIKVQFDLPERDGRALTPGMALPFMLDDGLAARTGVVTFVASAATPENNSFRVELTVPNPDLSLKPGMIVRVSLARRIYARALLVPLGAVVPHKGMYVVYAVRDNVAIRRMVQLGGLLGENAIVESGLEPGEVIVVEGGRALSDGSPVRIAADGDGRGP